MLKNAYSRARYTKDNYTLSCEISVSYIVHRVTKNWTWLSGWACTHAHSEWCSGDSDPDNYIPVSKPGVLRFMGSQRVGHDSATELNWTEPSLGYTICTWHISLFFFLHLFSFSPSWIATYSAIDLFTSGKVGTELPGVCAPICWLLECWSTEGFTIPQNPTRLDRDPLWCGGDCWGGEEVVVKLVLEIVVIFWSGLW